MYYNYSQVFQIIRIKKEVTNKFLAGKKDTTYSTAYNNVCKSHQKLIIYLSLRKKLANLEKTSKVYVSYCRRITLTSLINFECKKKHSRRREI